MRNEGQRERDTSNKYTSANVPKRKYIFNMCPVEYFEDLDSSIEESVNHE